MLAIVLLNLLSLTEVSAQNYSSETGIGALISKIWADAKKSNVDIYSVVFDDSYGKPKYSDYGNFDKKISYYSSIDDYMSSSIGDSSESSYKTVYIDKDGKATVLEYYDLGHDVLLLPEIQCNSKPRKYCAFCGKWILLEKWNEHNCATSFSVSDNVGTLPVVGGGGCGTKTGNENTDNTSQDSSNLKIFLDLTKKRGYEIKKIVEKLVKENRIKQYEVDKTAKNPKNNCYYDPKDHCLHVPASGGYNVDAITHELIHYLQEETIVDGKRMLDYDRCSADNEYQAYVMNYILDRTYNKEFGANGDAPAPQGVENTDEWQYFVKKLEKETNFREGQYFYTQNFIDELNKFSHKVQSEVFRSHYKAIDEDNLAKGAEKRTFENYYKNHDSDYNYNWEKMFNKLGFIKVNK